MQWFVLSDIFDLPIFHPSFTCLVVSDADYLPFTRLRTTNNVVRKELPPADDTTSTDIDIPYGLPFDNTSQTTAYVSADQYLE